MQLIPILRGCQKSEVQCSKKKKKKKKNFFFVLFFFFYRLSFSNMYLLLPTWFMCPNTCNFSLEKYYKFFRCYGPCCSSFSLAKQFHEFVLPTQKYSIRDLFLDFLLWLASKRLVQCPWIILFFCRKFKWLIKKIGLNLARNFPDFKNILIRIFCIGKFFFYNFRPCFVFGKLTSWSKTMFVVLFNICCHVL